MQFQPPSSPGWGQPEPEQQLFLQQSFPSQPSYQQPSSQPLPMQSTGYYPWPQQADVPSKQPPYQQPQWYQPLTPPPPVQQPSYSFPGQQFPVTPPPSSRPPQKKSRRNLYIGIVIAVVVIAIIGANMGKGAPSSNTDQSTSTAQTTTVDQSTPTVDQSTPTSTPTTASSTPFQVGETASNDTWSMTLNSVKTSNGDEVFAPKAGNVFLVVDVTVGNLTSSPRTVSSIASFVLQDSTGQAYNETFSDIGKPPDGTIQPGGKLRGQLVYEVPASMHNFTLQFQGSGFDGTSGTWAFSV